MEGTIRVAEIQLEKLKYVVGVNHLDIIFTGYTRLQPANPVGYSEAEVNLIFNNAEDVFKLGYLSAKERDTITFGKITINFP